MKKNHQKLNFILNSYTEARAKYLHFGQHKSSQSPIKDLNSSNLFASNPNIAEERLNLLK